jgi:hypothetical protein
MLNFSILLHCVIRIRGLLFRLGITSWFSGPLLKSIFFCSHLKMASYAETCSEQKKVLSNKGSLNQLVAPRRNNNPLRQTSMPWVGFEPTIPVFDRAKTFHALYRADTVIGPLSVVYVKLRLHFIKCQNIFNSKIESLQIFATTATIRLSLRWPCLRTACNTCEAFPFEVLVAFR